MNKAKKKSSKNKLTPQQIEQRNQKKEIRQVFSNLGFERLAGVDNKHFEYKKRTGEIDDIFIFENVVVLVEYTTGAPHEHLMKKNYFFERINESHQEFLSFIYENGIYESFCSKWDVIKHKYSLNQMQLRILYCSKQDIDDEARELVKGVRYFDYYIVQYFKSLSKVIKYSGRHEFMDFLEIPDNKVGEKILKSADSQSDRFYGHILPEERSSYDKGYKIVSFYIDAESLMRRAYVLRKEGWQNKDSIGKYQRMLEAKKIASMRKYLSTKERVYVNNIISTISENDIRFYADQSKEKELHLNEKGEFDNYEESTVKPVYIELENKCNIIGIIDGQHRTFSYYEGNDIYEKDISKLRGIQNLLVTGIVFPGNVSQDARLKFEANLFLEINLTQTNVPPVLHQEIASLIEPFSVTAVGKRIVEKLNASGPLNNLMEQYSFDKGKIKTASIVSFGLKPLIKYEGEDSLFLLWDHPKKESLKDFDNPNYDLLKEYVEFCSSKIRELFIALKKNTSHEQWKPYNPKDKSGMLTVTFINGALNLMRILIENKLSYSIEDYSQKLKGIESFGFRDYKSSQYRRMGQDLYDRFFK